MIGYTLHPSYTPLYTVVHAKRSGDVTGVWWLVRSNTTHYECDHVTRVPNQGCNMALYGIW